MTYSFKDLAEEVLASASVPMTPDEIWAEARRRGIDAKLSSQGKTPWRTLGAQLYTDVKVRPSRFVIHEGRPKRFSLAQMPSQLPLKFAVGAPHHTFTECAQRVLEAFANREPMHYLDITQKALEMGWLQTDGKTPEASLYAQVLTHISRAREKGERPLFVKYGKGMVGLSAWERGGIKGQLAKHNENVRGRLLDWLHQMPPGAFEQLVQRLLIEMGFEETGVTPISKDGGIDVRGTWEFAPGIRQRFAIQVKRWKNNVQAPVVRAIRGSLTNEEQGLIVTTADFSKGAREEAVDPKKHCVISLINGKQLVDLLIEHGIGVRKKPFEVLELVEEEFAHAKPSL